MGKSILVAGTKGGTSKTSTSVNLAAAFAQNGHDVLVVDTSEQENANKWAGSRARTRKEPPPSLAGRELAPISVSIKTGEDLDDYVRDQVARYDVVIVDSGGFDSAEFRASLLVADIWLIPVKVSAFGIQTFQQLNGLLRGVKSIRKANPLVGRPFAAMADVHDLSYDRETLEASLEPLPDFQVLRAVVRHRKVWSKAEALGVGVVEFQPADVKARTEMVRLYEEVCGLLSLPTTAEKKVVA